MKIAAGYARARIPGDFPPMAIIANRPLPGRESVLPLLINWQWAMSNDPGLHGLGEFAGGLP